MKAADRWIEIAAAVGDGGYVDWDQLQSTADPSDHAFVRDLRLVERIAALHASLPPVAAFEHSLHDSLLNLADRAASGPAPATWGPLAIVRKIGSGTYADVYEARDPRLDRPVALKLLRHRDVGTAADSEVIEEARLLARVRHPNVVTVFGAERIDGRVGIWMEYVDGRTLEQELRDRGPFSADEVTDTGVALAGALAAVHAAGLLHRDVKAQNVMRGSDGRVLLTDFGTGREAGGSSVASELAGTPLYLAPEVLERQHASTASDIYSLGVLLYHLATGTFPVFGRSLRDLRDAHERGARTALQYARPGLPRAVASAIDRAISAQPGERHQSAGEFEQALRAAQPRAGAPGGRWRAGAAAVVAMIAAGAVAFVVSRKPSTPTVPFQARDWVLISAFENRTGEALLDGTIEFAFERELTNSSFVNVVTRDRVNDVLRLMRKPADTTLDLTLAREVSLRDGAIRAILHGRVEKIGGRYDLTAQVVDPAHGDLLSSIDESVAGTPQLLAAVRREAFAIRGALGESRETLRASRQQLEKVTTPSLAALQHYSRGAAMMQRRGQPWNHAAAELFLRDALKEDPDFASASILLAWAIRNQGRPASEYLRHAEDARRSTASLPDVERYFVVGSEHSLRAEAATDATIRRRELTEAVAAYDSLIETHPDHAWVLNNLRTANYGLGRVSDAHQADERIAASRPNDFETIAVVASHFLEDGDLAGAERYAAQALHLLDAGPSTTSGLEEHIRLFPAHDAWLHDDLPGTWAVAEAAERRLAALTGDAHGYSCNSLALLYLGLGAVKRAETLAGGCRAAEPTQTALITRVLTQRADPGPLRHHLQLQLATILRAWPFADFFIGAGMVPQARQVFKEYTKDPHGDVPFIRYVGQRLAVEDAIARREPLPIDPSTALMMDGGQIGYGRMASLAERVADCLLMNGETSRAIEVLEAAASDAMRVRATAAFPPYLWLQLRAKLASLYRAAGRESEAQAVEDAVLKLLVFADPDHPLLLELKQRVGRRR